MMPKTSWISSAILTQYRLVTDGQMDGHRDIANTAPAWCCMGIKLSVTTELQPSLYSSRTRVPVNMINLCTSSRNKINVKTS